MELPTVAKDAHNKTKLHWQITGFWHNVKLFGNNQYRRYSR